MRSILVLLFLALNPPAQAARPFVTDDARVVDPDGWQIETFVKQQNRFKEREFWFLPAHDPGAKLLAGAWNPYFNGIVVSYGQSGEKPTFHTGLRLWAIPNCRQIDTTVGRQDASPSRRFASVGMRFLF